MGSLTRYTTFCKLSAKGELGIVMGRLMLALNDVGIANDALGQWMEEQKRGRKIRQTGAKMYFVRMLISHVFEALRVINKISTTPELLDIVQDCPRPAREAFDKCAAVIGTDRYKRMRSLRNGVGFHYLDETVRVAIASQAARAPDYPLSLSVGDKPLDWYGEPGDRIVDSAVVRQIFEVPEDAAVQKEVDRLIHEIQEIGDHLALFSGYFIMEHGPK